MNGEIIYAPIGSSDIAAILGLSRHGSAWRCTVEWAVA